MLVSRIQEPEAAKRYLKSAYEQNKTYLPTQKHLLTVNLMQVPRWHFRMLNDKVRNSVYKKAIQKAVKNHDTVVDIGAGCGLLSLFASQEKSVKKIHAIEMSKTFSKIAKKIFEENHASVNLINSDSTKLVDGSIKGNLIVTEVFDVALFGEHMLETLTHALEHLAEDNFEIIPRRASVYVTAIKSEDLLRTYKVTSNLPDIGFKDIDVLEHSYDPYGAEDLRSINVEYVTDTKPLIDVDFKDVEALRNLTHGQHTTVLKTICDSAIHAFAVWFDLCLDEEVKVTSSPLDDNGARCWDQAVFYLNKPLEVKRNQEIFVSCTVDDAHKLQISCLNVENCFDRMRFTVSTPVVSFLNDQFLVDQIVKFSKYFWERTGLFVLDLNPFPLLGLLLAKQGSTVYVQMKDNHDKLLVEHLINVNQITKFHFLDNVKTVIVLEKIRELDVMFLPPVSFEGSTDDYNLGLYPLFHPKLKEDGTNLISAINFMFQIIECEYLETYNKINDKNLCGFEIAKFFKEYEASEHACINLKSVKYKQLSETKFVGNLLEHCLDDTTHKLDVHIVETGKAIAFLYWYELLYFDNSKYDTRNSSHYQCAAILLPELKDVTANSIISVNFMQSDNFIGLYFCDN